MGAGAGYERSSEPPINNVRKNDEKKNKKTSGRVSKQASEMRKRKGERESESSPVASSFLLQWEGIWPIFISLILLTLPLAHN